MIGRKRKTYKPSQGAAAVVTGAASGIGRGFAYEIVRRGGSVICVDVDEQGAKAVAEELSSLGEGRAIGYQCDVSDAAQMETLANKADELLGRPITLLINNAGVWVGGPMGKVSLEDWRWCLDVNLWGVIHGCHFFTPKFKALGYGGIINVASIAGFTAVPSFTTYNVTKSAVMSLSETLAVELTGTDIQVTALCPSAVKTNVVANGRLSERTSKMANKVIGTSVFSETPEQVARTSLNALDRRDMYIMPQFDSRLLWRLKRFAPRTYAKIIGEVYKSNSA